MNQNLERYRVRPGLSISGEELLRRYKNNTLNIPLAGEGDFSMDTELRDFERKSKGEQMQSLYETAEKVETLKKSLKQ